VSDVQVPADAIMLHQIVNSNQFNGAGSRVSRQFVDEFVKPSGVDERCCAEEQNDTGTYLQARFEPLTYGDLSMIAHSTTAAH
jgi:hypothetical protein